MEYYFEGYPRSNGVAGTRNYVGIVSSVICSSAVVREISEKVQGTVPFVHANGCAQLGDDLVLTKNMLVGVASNPNIHSALIVGLGCETNQVSGLLKNIPKIKSIKGIGIQQLAGGENTIQKGIDITEKWVAEAKEQQREKLPLSSLTIGVLGVELDNDTLLATAPIIGKVVDKWTAEGVKVIVGMSKTLEPAGEVLAKRISDTAELEALVKSSEGMKRLRWDDTKNGSTTFKEFTVEQTQLALLESKMTGEKTINGILNYGEAPDKDGLHLMKTSSNVVESLSKMASAGCSAVVIVSSRGVLTGSIALPCITITSESDENAFDELVDYTITKSESTNHVESIMKMIQEVCSGKQTKLEELDLGEFSIPHLGTTY
ncbi:Altronate hydrolase [Planococcus halocryophilus Or1]|uniref:Altronate hydrolase n=1 Tax=Planococcus halocryophilus TaxID=1215089 RepID=A0A1C7DT21_9BACL|nr:UxaA family hydrolase [Planococcus halocryophilus]ANU14552.1 altronate hydrolase [Planococcus halocryophilus]EMF46723.1 Altronate hydrolase [Planococcus halocryophilus Or1]